MSETNRPESKHKEAYLLASMPVMKQINKEYAFAEDQRRVRAYHEAKAKARKGV